MYERPRRNSRFSGFTLVEIIVVVVILGVIAAMVIPSLIDTGDMQVISAARTVASDLQYAQNEAITSQAPVTISFRATSESYDLSNASGYLNHPMTRDEYVRDFAQTNGFERLDIVSASFGGSDTVTFDALGAPDNAGRVTLQAGRYVYQVAVAAATGKVSVTAGS